MRFRRASVSCSSAAGALLAATALLLAAPVQAKVFHSRQEALQLAFPTASWIDKKTHVLSPEQTAKIEALSGSTVPSKLVTIFTAFQGDAVLGHAHIDVQTVRTHPAAFMVVLEPDGSVRSLRVLAFHEPLDYLPADRWFSQFSGKTSADRLRVDGDVHGVVGATLTTRVATAGVRRVLAYHAVLIVGGGA